MIQRMYNYNIHTFPNKFQNPIGLQKVYDILKPLELYDDFGPNQNGIEQLKLINRNQII